MKVEISRYEYADVWQGKVNMKLEIKSFLTNRDRAVDYLNTCESLYVMTVSMDGTNNIESLCV